MGVGLEEPHTQVVHSLGRSVAQCLPRLSSQPPASLPPPTPLPSFSDPPHPFPRHRGNKMRLPLLARGFRPFSRQLPRQWQQPWPPPPSPRPPRSPQALAPPQVGLSLPGTAMRPPPSTTTSTRLPTMAPRPTSHRRRSAMALKCRAHTAMLTQPERSSLSTTTRE